MSVPPYLPDARAQTIPGLTDTELCGVGVGYEIFTARAFAISTGK